MRPLRVRYALIAGVVFGFGLASCASMLESTAAKAESASSAATTTALTATPSGVAINNPKPGVYTAGQPAAGDWSALADAGVRTVVNLRSAAEMKDRDEKAEVAAAGMRYVEIPIDGAGAINAESANKLSAILSEGAPVLVHCASANRAGGLLAVAMAQQGMPAEQALELGRSAGMKSTEARAREVIGEIR
jgi:uncharacterized protein (TIGR01244 family)